MRTNKSTRCLALAAMLVSLAATSSQVLGAVYAQDVSVGTFAHYNLSTTGDSLGGAAVQFAQLANAPYVDTQNGTAPKFGGTVTTTVYNNDDQNPYWTPATPGVLTFVYTIKADATYFDPISASIKNYTDPVNSVAINGWFRSTQAWGGNFNGVGAIKAFSVHRSTADAVSFHFDPDGLNYFTIDPGTQADLVLYSPLQDCKTDRMFLQNGGQAEAEILAPVPEPSTYLAGLSALCLLGFKAVSRRK